MLPYLAFADLKPLPKAFASSLRLELSSQTLALSTGLKLGPSVPLVGGCGPSNSSNTVTWTGIGRLHLLEDPLATLYLNAAYAWLGRVKN